LRFNLRFSHGQTGQARQHWRQAPEVTADETKEPSRQAIRAAFGSIPNTPLEYREAPA
jgi:hypothetical protein